MTIQVNKMHIESKLEISKNLKTVTYDGHKYRISQVITMAPGDMDIRHICNGISLLTYNWEFIFEHRKNRYYATFCPRCKALFMRPVR